MLSYCKQVLGSSFAKVPGAGTPVYIRQPLSGWESTLSPLRETAFSDRS